MGEDGPVRAVLRYPLIWLGCTAVSIGAVMLTVDGVAGSDAAGLPGSRSVLATAVALPGQDSPNPSPVGQIGDPTSVAEPAPPSPAATPDPAPASPRPSPSSPPESPTPECGQNAAVHTFLADGGTATVSFGSTRVCLVTVVPAAGFTATTHQVDPGMLVVIFSSPEAQSRVTVTNRSQSGHAVIENGPSA